MTTIFIILIVIASAVLGLIVLVQNPKGGGLAGNIAGFSNQFMGVKQTTDVLEKGTWLFAGLIAALSMFSVVFISKNGAGNGPDRTKEARGATVPSTNPTLPTNTVPLNPSGTVSPTK
jgi:preprotein translocase subunit SecG